MKQYLRQIIELHLLASLVFLLASCESVNGKVGGTLNLDTDLKLQITAESTINPDEQDKSSPVFIRLYELSTPESFEKASFIDLYERDEEILGDTFIAKQELKRVVPGADRTQRFILSKKTRYVALFAEFYQYKDSRASLVFPVTSGNLIRNFVKVKVSGNSLELIK